MSASPPSGWSVRRLSKFYNTHLNRNSLTMERYDRGKVQEFFKKFWSDPANVERFNVGSSNRARSANCRLVRGNVALMSDFVTTDADHENLCKELGLPLLKFVVN